jgi:2-keto-3-deoxy-6-phosphogluconate aldolase
MCTVWSNKTRIEHAGVVAVVREDSQKRAIEAARAVIKGGIKGIEVRIFPDNCHYTSMFNSC